VNRRTLAALALPLLLAAPVVAQDRDPAIFEVQMNGQKATEGPLGAVLMFKGKNFHLCPQPKDPNAPPPGSAPPPGGQQGPAPKNACRHEDVKVKIGGAEAMLLAASPENVTFIVPQYGVSAGRVKLRLEIKGKKSTEADFTLFTPEEWEKRSAKDKESQAGQEAGAPIPGAGGTSSFQPDLDEEIRGKFKITRFELKRDVGANRFEVEGVTSQLPDDFTISVVLQFEDPGQAPREIDARKVRVQKGVFTVIFGPYTKELLYGNYVATLLFELGKQSQVRARKFLGTLSDKHKEVYERIQRREYSTVGTEQEIADQRKKIQEHYQAFSKDCQKLLADFESAYGCAARSFFRAPGGAGFEEPKYAEYLTQTLGLAPDVVDKIKRDTRFATNQGHFKPKEYQQWGEKTFIPAILAAYQKHLDFKGRYIAPLDERADQYSDYLISIVMSLFREWSRQTYDRSKIEFPAVLDTIPINPIMSPTVSKQFFTAQRRLLLRQVGLGSVVAAEDAAEAGKQ
jgi:hypothetical protein